MFSQQQDPRQTMPGGMQMQQQVQGQVQHNMGGQMPQMPMQMGNPQQQQQPMGAMPQSIPQQNLGLQRPMGAMGSQHNMTNMPGIQPPMAMGGGVRGPAVGGPPQQPMMIKPEPSGQSPQVPNVQRMPGPSQPQAHSQEGQNLQNQAAPQDRIVRFKQLLPQLKECLVSLISIARQNFAANATIDNSEKTIDTSLIPRFDKALENFYSICNQIELNFMVASEQLSHTIFSVQYTPLTANPMKDNVNNPQVYTSYINTVKQQLAYAKEIQGMLMQSSENILARQRQLQQLHQRGQNQF